MGALLRSVPMTLALAIVFASCESDDSTPGTPTSDVTPGTMGPGPTPDYTACPVDEETCALANRVVSALDSADVDALMAMTRPIVVQCPVPRPGGVGGPYPLCESAVVNGEEREGFAWSSLTEGGMVDADRLRSDLQALAELDVPLRTIGCVAAESTPAVCQGNLILAFGPQSRGASMEIIYELPIAREGSDPPGIVGLLPHVVPMCETDPIMWPCQLMHGGEGPIGDYEQWGTDPGGQPSADGRYFRWTRD